VYIADGSVNNVVRHNEITGVGTGVVVFGQHNLVTQNYIHDLHMVRSTPGGDNDMGAVGVWLYDSHNEVSHNTFVNCRAPSEDYGYDGGAVEWWPGSGTIEGGYVHHNWAIGCEGFAEMGGQGGIVRDAIIAYNVSINNGWLVLINLPGSTYATHVEKLRIDNNTIYQVEPHGGWGAVDLLLFYGYPDASTLSWRNNVFYSDGWNISNRSDFTHDHNLYHFAGTGELGFQLGDGEIVADPLFLEVTLQDFHLHPTSPAIDAGVDLGYSSDFENRSVPAGAAPDMGAYEYGARIAPAVFLPIVLSLE
jgi:hypothetical protein